MSILVVDCYDSFTYNLVHLIEKVTGEQPAVVFSDQFEPETVQRFDAVVLSPGPGLPAEAGNILELIRQYAGDIPILGVCLGHQAIAEAFGGKLYNLPSVHHGVAHTCTSTDADSVLLNGLPAQFPGGRYHSWVVHEATLPSGFVVTSRDPDGFIMSMENPALNICSVQFHPESVLTPHGEQILRNWLQAINP